MRIKCTAVGDFFARERGRFDRSFAREHPTNLDVKGKFTRVNAIASFKCRPMLSGTFCILQLTLISFVYISNIFVEYVHVLRMCDSYLGLIAIKNSIDSYQ